MNNREWFRLAWAKARGIARWAGPKLIARVGFAFGAMSALLAFVALGWIPADLLQETIAALAAVLTLF